MYFICICIMVLPRAVQHFSDHRFARRW
jgi:hypothetical protein